MRSDEMGTHPVTAAAMDVTAAAGCGGGGGALTVVVA